MKQIKLEVGKTYLSRNGEEVKITGCDGGYYQPYKGSNGKWYTESGRFDFCTKGPADLIEEVEEAPHAFGLVADALTATRYIFKIPDGVKEITLSYEGKSLVVEMVPEAKAPKPGDVCLNDIGSVYIFKEAVSKHTHRHYAWFGRDGRVVFNESAISGRPATPEEAQPLWDALKKAGKRWNAETMEVEDVPEIERIREWVEANIEYRHYTKEVIAEAIEAYLKYRESKK